MHPAALLPRYDCKCVLWQPSKHNLLAQLLIFCTLALPVSWHWGNRETELFFVCLGDQLLLADRPYSWAKEKKGQTFSVCCHLLCTHPMKPLSILVTLELILSLILSSRFPSNITLSLHVFSHWLTIYAFPFLYLSIALFLPASPCLIQCNICCHFSHTQRLITRGGERMKNKSEPVWGGQRESESEREGGRVGQRVLRVNYSSYIDTWRQSTSLWVTKLKRERVDCVSQTCPRGY